MPLGNHKSKKIIEMPNGYLLCLYVRNKLTGEIKNYAETNILILIITNKKNKLSYE